MKEEAGKLPSRRGFLRGKFVPERESDVPQADASPEAVCMRYTRRAMADDFVLFLNAGEYEGAQETVLDALDEITRLEAELSYFREESEISRINRLAGFRPVETSEEVYRLLRLCDEIGRVTHGAFDITATPLWEVWGFMKRRGSVPDEAARAEALERVGMDALEWDDARYGVKFRRPGVKISLGAIGKGWAVDAAARVLEAAGVRNFLLHGGASSVVARGARRGREDWLVGLHHPLKPGVRLREIPLRDRALGTSGSATQFFWSGGKRFGHILDPRTGFPVTDVLSATALAPDAARADALATACCILGVEGTREVCATWPELGVIFVLPSGEVVEQGEVDEVCERAG